MCDGSYLLLANFGKLPIELVNLAKFQILSDWSMLLPGVGLFLNSFMNLYSDEEIFLTLNTLSLF